jgi:hypothetical protein
MMTRNIVRRKEVLSLAKDGAKSSDILFFIPLSGPFLHPQSVPGNFGVTIR